MNLMLGSLFALLRAASEREDGVGVPYCIIIDDIQFLDDISWQFVDRLMTLPRVSVVLLGQVALVEPQNKPILDRFLSSCNELHLEVLSKNDLSGIFSGIFGGGKQDDDEIDIPEKVLESLLQQSSGLPLLATQLCRLWRRQDSLRIEESDDLDGFRKKVSIVQEVFDVEQKYESESSINIRRVITEIIDKGLSPDARTLAKRMSVCATYFSPKMVQGMTVELISADNLLEAIQTLVDNKFWAVSGDGHFFWEHNTIPSCIASSLTSKQRIEAHRAFLSMLTPEDCTTFEVIAEHYRQADCPWMALQSFFGAAEQAFEGHNNRGCKKLLEAGSDALSQVSKMLSQGGPQAVEETISDFNAATRRKMEFTQEKFQVLQCKIRRLHGEVLCVLDAPKDGQEHLEASLRNSGEVFLEPNMNSALPLLLQLETAKQAFQAASGNVFIKARLDNNEWEIAREKVRAFDRMARVYFQTGEPLKAMYSCYRGVNLGESIGHTSELAKTFATLAFVRKSIWYCQKSGAVARSPGIGPQTTSYCLMLEGGMLIGEGNYEDAARSLKLSLDMSSAIQDRQNMGLTLSVLGWCYFVEGNFNSSLECSQTLREMGAESENDVRFANWGLVSLMRDFLALDRMQDALNLEPNLKKYVAEFGSNMMNSDRVHVAGLQIKLALHRSDVQEVREILCDDKLVETLKSVGSQLVEFDGFATCVDGLIHLHEETSEFEERCIQALESFEKYAGTYPVVACRYLLLLGRFKKNLWIIAQGGLLAEHFRMKVETSLAKKHSEFLQQQAAERKDIEVVDVADETVQAFANKITTPKEDSGVITTLEEASKELSNAKDLDLLEKSCDAELDNLSNGNRWERCFGSFLTDVKFRLFGMIRRVKAMGTESVNAAGADAHEVCNGATSASEDVVQEGANAPTDRVAQVEQLISRCVDACQEAFTGQDGDDDVDVGAMTRAIIVILCKNCEINLLSQSAAEGESTSSGVLLSRSKSD